MMIDYVTLMLTNMVCSFVILAFFLLWGLESEDKKKWSPAFGISGLVATVCGFRMSFTWPLPVPYNCAYGKMSVLLGVLFLSAGWSLAKDWDLLPMGIYAFFAGGAACLLGVRIIDQHLTLTPLMSGIGFILSGACGLFAGLVLWHRKIKALRITGAVVLLIAAAIWLLTAYMAYWSHLAAPKK
jgi:putative membrane protein